MSQPRPPHPIPEYVTAPPLTQCTFAHSLQCILAHSSFPHQGMATLNNPSLCKWAKCRAGQPWPVECHRCHSQLLHPAGGPLWSWQDSLHPCRAGTGKACWAARSLKASSHSDTRSHTGAHPHHTTHWSTPPPDHTLEHTPTTLHTGAHPLEYTPHALMQDKAPPTLAPECLP